MKKLVVILMTFLSLWIFSSCENSDSEKQVKKYYKTQVVQTGSLDYVNSYIWYIESEKTVDLATKLWWRITDIHVGEADEVKSWDLLATLDSKEAKVGYSISEDIIDSLESMKTSTTSMYDEQILAMNQKLEQIKLWENQTKTWLEDTKNIWDKQLQTAKIGIKTAKINLENTKELLETKEKHIYDNSKNAITKAVILDTNIIKYIDELLWITDENKEKNNSFDDYLWVKNTSLLPKAVENFKKVNTKYKEYKKYYDEKIEWQTPDKQTIIEWLDKWEELAEIIKKLLDSTYDVIDNSLVNISFTADTINAHKTQISSFWNDVESSLLTVSWEYMLWLKWSKQSLIDFRKNKTMQIELLEEQLNLAQKTYDSYEVTKNAKLREIETWWSISKSQIKEIESSIESLKKQKQLKISELNTKINEAKWEKNSSIVNIDSWKIYASMSWVIIKKLAEEWQVVWGWQTIFKLANNDDLIVKIDVLEEQFNDKIDRQNVILEIDWYEEQISWKITKILPSKDMITKKIGLEISIVNPEWKIKIWSYTKVFLKQKANKNSIVIPNNAIISKFMIPWVYIKQNNKAVFTKIEIIKSSDKFSEIKWLKVWDIIITDWKENIWDGEIIN